MPGEGDIPLLAQLPREVSHIFNCQPRTAGHQMGFWQTAKHLAQANKRRFRKDYLKPSYTHRKIKIDHGKKIKALDNLKLYKFPQIIGVSDFNAHQAWWSTRTPHPCICGRMLFQSCWLVNPFQESCSTIGNFLPGSRIMVLLLNNYCLKWNHCEVWNLVYFPFWVASYNSQSYLCDPSSYLCTRMACVHAWLKFFFFFFASLQIQFG